ncbi:MAG: 30S ribosomal protein S20 [Candidatus Pacebacteria bacterium]|nr:30S ribosomal protein S20 [Candidatus Paceibacterota bacterium]
MPITKSAKKALRQNKTRRVRNLQKKKKIKLLFKKVVDLSKQKKEKQAQEILPQYYKALDKAVKTGLIKKNTASRKKSRLTKAINKIQS